MINYYFEQVILQKSHHFVVYSTKKTTDTKYIRAGFQLKKKQIAGSHNSNLMNFSLTRTLFMYSYSTH